MCLDATRCCRFEYRGVNGPKLTFRDLKTKKGWPYSRQHTHKLVKAGRFPTPDKLYEGGLLNVWDEDKIDTHLAAVTDRENPRRCLILPTPVARSPTSRDGGLHRQATATAGALVAPAGRIQTTDLGKGPFEFAMNIYTETALPQPKPRPTAPRRRRSPGATPCRSTPPPSCSRDVARRTRGARQGHPQARSHVVDRVVVRRKVTGTCSTAAVGSTRSRSRSGSSNRRRAEPHRGQELSRLQQGDRTRPLGRPYAYVTSANIHRRHLTAEQKRELIAKLIEADPTKSNRQIAKTVKVDHKTVASGQSGEGGTWGNSPRARPGPTARAGGSSHGRPRRSRPVFRGGVATARGRRRTHSRSQGRQQGPRRHRLPERR